MITVFHRSVMLALLLISTQVFAQRVGVTITESGGMTEVEEGGAADSYDLVLNTQPTANVTVTLTVPGAQLLTDTASLTFTPANWNVAQSVTVNAVNDTVDEGPHSATITHAATSADGDYNGKPVADVIVSIIDNDRAGITVTESAGTTEVEEGGATDSYTVVLGTAPSAAVTVTLTVPAQLSTDKTNLTFTTGNWNVAQTVTVTAVDDSAVEGPHQATITQAATSGDAAYDGISVADVVVSITDNDRAGVIVTESAGTTEVEEGGATDGYAVVLSTAPSAAVTVTLTVPAQLSTDKTNLTFTTGNWNVAQTVTVTAVDDSAVEGSHQATVTHASSSADTGYNAISVADVVVSITDNDRAGVIVTESAGTTEVEEGGATDGYAVVLSTAPSAAVTVTLTVPAQLSTDKTNLTFTTGNWNVAQTVTVTAVDDSAVEGPHQATITQAATSGDAAYDGISVADVVVSITDNDRAGVIVTESGGATKVAEGGTGDSYTVVLATQPAANVTVALAVPNQLTTDKTNLTFTVANWNAAQTVTVNAVDDVTDEGLHMATVSHAAASGDANYDGVSVADVVISITDNDRTVSFTATPTNGPAPLLVSFTDTSTGTTTNRLWNFGDTGTSTLASPSHTYSNAGIYSVSLTVFGPDGSGTSNRPDFITVTNVVAQPPAAGFTANPTNGAAPLLVFFNDTSTGAITNRVWTFGDGATSGGANPMHTYSTAGMYSVSLAVFGPGGVSATNALNLVTATNVMARAGFSASPTNGVAPLLVNFTDASTGTITNRLWDFGDGTSSTATSPSHTYTNAGSYSITLTVFGPAGGNSLTQPNLITVTNASLTADLEVIKIASPSPVGIASNLIYTITVTNHGPAMATAVTLTDALPASVSFVSASDECTNSSGLVLCDLGSLTSGQSTNVILMVVPILEGSVTNIAGVVAAEADPNPANNAGTAIVQVFATPPPPHDLAVVKLKAPRKIALSATTPSKIGKFKITIQNLGPQTETIPNLTVLGHLVGVDVQSLGTNCPSFTAALVSPKASFPINLARNGKLNLAYTGTFNCANDPAATTKTALHNDYQTSATIDLSTLGEVDTTAPNNVCPRLPDPGIGDIGCGSKYPSGALGADVLTDIVVK